MNIQEFRNFFPCKIDNTGQDKASSLKHFTILNGFMRQLHTPGYSKKKIHVKIKEVNTPKYFDTDIKRYVY